MNLLVHIILHSFWIWTRCWRSRDATIY